ncbi:MAG: hypothetical protein HC834_05625, partial [Rhodospirillales bacterium]|nr:hypothetical protein [Rhodospirillales bacterium]
LLVGFGARRKQEESEDAWSIDSAVVDFQELEPSAPEPAPAGVDSRTPVDADRAARSASVPAPKEHEPEIDAGLPSPSSQLASFSHFETETEEADVLSEADIYIAYGRYKEAESCSSASFDARPSASTPGSSLRRSMQDPRIRRRCAI